jgi:hypothetical protein
MAKKKPAPEAVPQQDAVDEAAGIARETMLGDLMQVIKSELSAQTEPWRKMTEEQQTQALERICKGVESAIDEAVRIIATENRPVITATVDAVTFKDGIKATIKLAKHSPGGHELADSTGHQVMIVVGGAEAYKGGAGDVVADPAQASLLLQDIAQGNAGTLSEADQKLAANLQLFGYIVPAAIVASWTKKERKAIESFLGGTNDKGEPPSIKPYSIATRPTCFIVSEGVGTDTEIRVWARTAPEAEAIYRERVDVVEGRTVDVRPAIGAEVPACLNPDNAPKDHGSSENAAVPDPRNPRPDIPGPDVQPPKMGDGTDDVAGDDIGDAGEPGPESPQ